MKVINIYHVRLLVIKIKKNAPAIHNVNVYKYRIDFIIFYVMLNKIFYLYKKVLRKFAQ